MSAVIILAVVVSLGILLTLSVRVVNQCERGVHFRLGRIIGVREPGVTLTVPARDRLDAWLEPVRSRFPEVVVDPITTEAPADEVLVRYSSSAELLIVGRGVPAAPRGILGRTATGVLMHATCPVIFAGPHRRLRHAGK
ncbi:hypothetical protein [Rhodococcus wratislaviensis]|uniref:hypothetical protein n=1 Tax=Rhodococcus wratislaviensis TaxID=44752 RepID=UPI003661336F